MDTLYGVISRKNEVFLNERRKGQSRISSLTVA